MIRAYIYKQMNFLAVIDCAPEIRSKRDGGYCLRLLKVPNSESPCVDSVHGPCPLDKCDIPVTPPVHGAGPGGRRMSTLRIRVLRSVHNPRTSILLRRGRLCQGLSQCRHIAEMASPRASVDKDTLSYRQR